MVGKNRKKYIGVLLGLAVLCGLGIYQGKIRGALEESRLQAITYRSKDSTEELGSEKNPFTILEIVPTEEMAAVGYEIPGCEPVKNLSTDTTGAMEQYKTIYAGDGGLSTVEDIVGTAFRADVPSNLGFSDAFIRDNLLVNDQEDSYGQYGYFVHAKGTDGTYKYAQDMGCFVPVAVDDPDDQMTYNWVPLVAYSENADGNGAFFRTGNTYTNEKLDGEDATAAYYAFEPGVSADSLSYDMTALVEDVTGEDAGSHTQETILFSEIGSSLDTEGKRVYTYRCEEKHVVYSQQQINHKDGLVQTLFTGKSTADGFVSQVVTVAADQLAGSNISGENNIITDADMIVIHDSAVALPIYCAANRVTKEQITDRTFGQTNDLSAEAYEAILKRQASGNPAMMLLDESCMDYQNSGTARASTYVQKLYVAMNKYGAKYFYNVFCPNESGVREVDPDATGSAVYNYTDHARGLHTARAAYVLNWDGGDGLLSKELTGETSAYLSAMDQARSTTGKRTHLRILEIEPIPTFIYGNQGWKSYYAPLFADFIGTDSDLETDLTVTCMATYEFNSKIEDLNATYDMVILGANQDETNGKNGYNDTALGNLAYATLGDLITTDSGDTYFIDKNFFAFNKTGSWGRYDADALHWIAGKLDAWNMQDWSENFIGSSKGSDFAQSQIRYEATDILQSKYQELLVFSQKNPIVVDGSFYQTDLSAVNSDRIDSSSFVYSLAQAGLDGAAESGQVLTYAGAVKADSALATWMQGMKCTLSFSADGSNQGQDGQPVSYQPSYGTTTVTWNNGKNSAKLDKVLKSSTSNDQTDADGNPVLRYHFSLQGDADALYQVRIYLDSNGNGSFEDEECSSEPAIMDTTEGTLYGKVENGNLQAGHTYTVERALPASQWGMLPWKIVVSAVGAEGDRDCATGYTRIASYGQKETIRILQMNLTSDMKSEAATTISFSDQTKEIGAKFAAYLENVEDFDVDLNFRSNEWFRYNYEGKKEKWASDLQEYDMLILGFCDESSFTDQEDFLYGFQKFVASGKSVILGHDMVQDKSFAYPSYDGSTDTRETGTCWNVDQEISAYLRQLSGQTQRYYSNQSQKGSYEYTYSQGQKVSTLPKEDLEVAYYWRWHNTGWFGASGYWDYTEKGNEGRWMTQEDYLSTLAATGEKICNLMDNSVRVMTYTARLRQTTKNGIDRTIYSPNAQMKQLDDTSLDWPSSVVTETVRIANQGQITTYPYTMEDTITVGKTHAQNYRLDLENATSTGLNFRIEGDYDDWKDVPSQTTGNNPQEKVNKGSLIYVADEKKAYGHVEIHDSNKDNPGSYRTFGISIKDTNGNEIGRWTDPFTIDEEGNITRNPQMDGQEIGKAYTYYFGEVDRSGNINQLFENEYGEDAVYGKMIVTRWQDYVEIEYEIDVAEMVRHQNKWHNGTADVETIEGVQCEFSSICASGESFSSDYTKEYVEQATKSGDRAIVWYNLSNDEDDVTNIYAAREGDASNNYYLYTKGNITYTGLGHTGTMTDDEIRLFVNTMISSYRRQQATPYLSVTNEDVIRNGSIHTFYTQDRSVDTQDITVHLLVSDPSISSLAKTYQLTIRDENGSILVDHVTVKKDDIYDFTIAAGDLDSGQETYTATLESSYTQATQNYTTENTITLRAMRMPLFGLH